MTRRCRHEYETKAGYPDDMICHKCQTIWTITDYLSYNAIQLMTLPKAVRYAVVKRQAERFAKDNPDYYQETSDER
jgi:hypothetical protein